MVLTCTAGARHRRGPYGLTRQLFEEKTTIRRPFKAAAPTKDGPPVTKILDLGKLKYANQKKAAEARKHQKVIEIKEIKMRPNIDIHDYEVKMKSVRRFFEEGDKVKLTLRFRGREMAHLELGMQLLQKVREEVGTIAKVEAEPKLEGRQMMMVLAPR